MNSETNKIEENAAMKPAICESGVASDRNEKTGNVFIRRKFCQTGAIAGGLAAATLSNSTPGTAPAADVTPDFTALDATRKAGPDFSKIPQRLHQYPASDRAKEIVRRSITMDSL
jgi:hypothetical protein